jgi:hypothetical protein
MESLATDLRAQLSDYLDIEKIFVKFEEEKSLNKIHKLFQTLFADSSKAILEASLEKNRENLDNEKIKADYDKNLLIFKNKFTLIVQMMIENVYTSCSPKASKNQQEEEQTGGLEDKPRLHINTKILSEDKLSTFSSRLNSAKSTGESEGLLSAKLTSKCVTPSKKDRRSKAASPVTPAKTTVREVSYILRPNKGATTPSKSKSKSKARKQDSTTNTSIKNWDNLSKYDGFSPLGRSSLSSTMLGQSPGGRSCKSSTGDKSFRKLLNFSPSQTLLMQSQLNTTPSIYSSRIPTNNNNGLMSEFNHIKGSVSFSQAARNSWVDVVAKTDSPGPAEYTPKMQNRSRSPSMGKSPRECWVDVVARTDSPGPARYNPTPRASSPTSIIGKAARTSWIDVVAKTDSPGPGRYSARTSRNASPSHSIGRAVRESWVDVVARTDSPGPGAHYGSMHFLSK